MRKYIWWLRERRSLNSTNLDYRHLQHTTDYDAPSLKTLRKERRYELIRPWKKYTDMCIQLSTLSLANYVSKYRNKQNIKL